MHPETWYSPDGSPGGPPAEASERVKQMVSAILPVVLREVKSVAYDPDVDSAINAWRNSDDYKKVDEEARQRWQSEGQQLGISEDQWMGITHESRDVYFYADYKKVSGKNAETATVVSQLAKTFLVIEAGFGGDENAEKAARKLVGRMVDEVNSHNRGYQMTGEVHWADVERKLPSLRKEVEKAKADEAAARVRKEKEEMEKQKAVERQQRQKELEELTEKLKLLGAEKLRALGNDLRANSLFPDDVRGDLPEVLGQEVIDRIEFSPMKQKDAVGYSFWIEAVQKAYEKVEFPEVRLELRRRMVNQLYESMKYGPEAVRAFVGGLIEPVREAYFRGEFTDYLQKLVPKGMRLFDYWQELEAIAYLVGLETQDTSMNRIKSLAEKIGFRMGNGKRREIDLEKVLFEEDLQRERLMEIIDQTREEGPFRSLGFERGLEEMLMLPQYQEVVLKARQLYDESPDTRLTWALRLNGTLIRAGRSPGMAKIYLTAIAGDGLAPAEEAMLGSGVEWIMKALSLTGYSDRERYMAEFGFFPPEVLAEIMDRKVPVKTLIRDTKFQINDRGEMVRVNGEGRWVQFGISAQDVEAEIYHFDEMAEFNANEGRGVDSHAYANMKFLRRAFLRKMGYPRDLVLMWDEQQQVFDRLKSRGLLDQANRYKATWTSHYPEVLRSNLITFSELLDVDSLDALVGENWWMVMAAKADISWKRTDLMLLPTDGVRRRSRLHDRDSIAGYARDYDKVSTPGQVWQELSILPDYDGYTVNETLLQVLLESRELSTGLLLNTPDGRVNGEGLARLEARKLVIEQIVKANQVSPDQAKWVGSIVMAKGVFDPGGKRGKEAFDWWKSQVREYMPKLERTDIFRLRPFELWPDIEIAIPNELSLKAGLVEPGKKFVLEGEDYLKALFEGMPFEPWLRDAGLNDEELERLRYDEGIREFELDMKKAGVPEKDRKALVCVGTIGELRENFIRFYLDHDGDIRRIPSDNPNRSRVIEGKRREFEGRFLRYRKELSGGYGLGCFRRNGSYALFKRARAKYKDLNSETRYPKPAKSTIDTMAAALDMGMNKITEEKPSKPEEMPLNVILAAGRRRVERRNSPAYLSERSDVEMANIVNERMPELIEKISETVAELYSKGFGGFMPKTPTYRLAASMARTYADTQVAWSGDAIVYDVDVEGPDFDAMAALSMKMINRKMLHERARELFGDEKGMVRVEGESVDAGEAVEQFLRGHMIYFIEAYENRLAGGKRRDLGKVLLGPHSAFVPNVEIAAKLVERMLSTVEEKKKLLYSNGRGGTSESAQLKEAEHILNSLKQRNLFGWRLVRGAANLNALAIIEGFIEGLVKAGVPPTYLRNVVDELVQYEQNGLIDFEVDLGAYSARPTGGQKPPLGLGQAWFRRGWASSKK